ncbi:MAG: hypothetical protein ABSA76_10070 [Bacteroidales bacterium]
MKDLLRKLNYKENKRIAFINAGDFFHTEMAKELNDVIIDREIDQRCPYEFIMIFVSSVAEVENFAPIALHNLAVDGILWFCYPKKTSKKYATGPERDHGWKSLNDAGFFGIRMVSIDEDWSALRFRNIKYIKSTSNRFPK